MSVQKAPQSSGFAPPQLHAPAWHVEPGFVSAHRVPHAPHAPESAWRSRQRGISASQRVSAPGHWQTPAEQVAPAPQATPQLPQLAGSVWNEAGSTQRPAQIDWPEGHAGGEDGAHADPRAAVASEATRAAAARFIPP